MSLQDLMFVLLVLCSHFVSETLASPTVSSSLTRLSTPYAWSNITWSGVPSPSTSDWLAVFCTGGTYYYWVYATGAASGSLPLRLFANSPGSGCTSLQIGYYHGSSVLMSSAPIPIDPMIQQVRLSLTSDPTEMVVDFVSTAGGDEPACRYGSSPAALTQRAQASSTAVPAMGNVSHALLQGLTPSQRTFYACSDGKASSAVYNFTAGGLPASGPQRVAIFADFGVNDGFGLDQIAQDAAAGAFDLALHAGDCECCLCLHPPSCLHTWRTFPHLIATLHYSPSFLPPLAAGAGAYNLESGNSANGNFFMNRAMLYSAQQPVQPAPGNRACPQQA
jgi:hypothetical protein